MGARFYVKLFSRLGFVLAILAVASCFYPQMLFFGMMSSVIGTLMSVLVIFTRTKYGVPTKWTNISVISIALCSVPVLYVLTILILKKA